jgi:hypothetical protein
MPEAGSSIGALPKTCLPFVIKGVANPLGLEACLRLANQGLITKLSQGLRWGFFRLLGVWLR